MQDKLFRNVLDHWRQTLWDFGIILLLLFLAWDLIGICVQLHLVQKPFRALSLFAPVHCPTRHIDIAQG